jgi:hypothetical protein
MAEYSELPVIVGEMKRAAIDCWMTESSHYPYWADDKLYCLWGWVAVGTITRPAADGTGGGHWVDVTAGIDTYLTYFDDIRAAIDSRVGKWSGLPDGSGCEHPRSLTNSTAAILGASGTGSAQANGEISTANSTVKSEVLHEMEGEFRAPLVLKYVDRLSVVVSGLASACMILEMAYTVEGRMWPAAQKDVANICDAARNAFREAADGRAAANATLTLSIAGAIVGAISAVVTAGTSLAAVAVLSAATAVITSASAAITADQAVNVEGNRYADILDSLGKALGHLNDALFKQEDALRTAMTNASSTMYDDLAHFDLDKFALGSYPSRDAGMKIGSADARLVTTSMATIETELNEATTAISAAPNTSPTPRDSSVGIGAEGPHPASVELYSLTARCIALTAQEYARGHALFDATVTLCNDTDAESKARLNRLLATEVLSVDVKR